VRFLLDENFPKSVISLLAERGDEVIELRSVGLLGASDALIAQKAIETGAVILTTDRDFFHTVSNTFAEHPGIIVIAVRQPSRSLITERLCWFLANVDEQHWKNRVFQLRDTTWLTRPPIA
jgi:predicted nuclease of predicted toxin-antitoxin system